MRKAGVKQPGSPRGTRPIPIPAQSVLITAAALLIGVVVAVFVSAWAVNNMKDLLVQETHAEARRAARHTCEQIRNAFAGEAGMTLEEILERPEIRSHLEMLSMDEEVVMACVVDDEGNMLYEFHRNEGAAKNKRREIMAELVSAQPGAAGAAATSSKASFIPVALPIERDGEQLGRVLLAVSRDRALARIESLSESISLSLLVMSATVLTVLLATVALLTYVFRRHAHLIHRTASAEHLVNLGTLASGLAHEIRNPLHSMNLRLDVLREDLEEENEPIDRRELAALVDEVKGQTENLNNVVSNFVKLSLPSQLSHQPLKFDVLVREAVQVLEEEFAREEIEVDIDLPDSLPINGDQRALLQVVLNILLNARQALRHVDSRVLWIRGRDVRKGWEIAFDDSGPGIPKEEEEAIFRGAIAKRTGSTGFGLSLARQIIDGHGGSIHAERSDLGGARIVLQVLQMPKRGEKL